MSRISRHGRTMNSVSKKRFPNVIYHIHSWATCYNKIGKIICKQAEQQLLINTKVFVLHELENNGCCEADGGYYFVSRVHGVFPTKEAAKEFQKKDKYLKRCSQITETEMHNV
jgi:hypothetical protein